MTVEAKASRSEPAWACPAEGPAAGGSAHASRHRPADASSANRVNVSTYSGTGVPADHAFHLAVFC